MGSRATTMAISTHCRWPWARVATGAVQQRLQAEARGELAGARVGDAPAMARARGEVEVLVHAEPVEDVLDLVLDADAEAPDPVRGGRGDVGALEQDRAGAGLDLARSAA